MNNENDLRIARELLFMVLDHIGYPLTIDMDKAKQRMSQDTMIDMSIDSVNGMLTIQVKDLKND